MPLPLPSTDPFNVSINLEQRRAVVAGQVLNQYFTLVNPALDRTSLQPLADDGAIEDFATTLAATMKSGALAELAAYKFVGLEEIDADAAETYQDERRAGGSPAGGRRRRRIGRARRGVIGARPERVLAVPRRSLRRSVGDRDTRWTVLHDCRDLGLCGGNARGRHCRRCRPPMTVEDAPGGT